MSWDIRRQKGVANDRVPSYFNLSIWDVLLLRKLQRQELWVRAGRQFSGVWDR